jgi:hypothetical protein
MRVLEVTAINEATELRLHSPGKLQRHKMCGRSVSQRMPCLTMPYRSMLIGYEPEQTEFGNLLDMLVRPTPMSL